MQFPKLTPLQSRFAASLTASVLLVVVYFFLWNPHYAYAAGLEEVGLKEGGLGLNEAVQGEGEDHNWARIAESDGLDWHEGEDDGLTMGDWSIKQEGVSVDWHRGKEHGLPVDWQEQELDNEDDAFHDADHGDESHEKQAVLEKRATTGVTSLGGSNIPGVLNIDAGETQYWVFTNTSLWGNYTDPGVGLPSTLEDDDDDNPDTLFRRDGEGQLLRRQDEESRTVYISINTCLQPGWNSSTAQTEAPPQLTLYISTSTSNQKPGANVTDNSTQVVLELDQGFAMYSMNASTDVYLSVAAPDLPTNFSGVWNYNLAVSIDAYYHMWHNSTFLHLVDTDSLNALLVTDNLTQANASSIEYQLWMNLSTPFIVFAQNNQDPAILGVERSYCGMQTTPAQIMANVADPAGLTGDVQMGMVTRGLGNKPKEQFYIKSLNASSSYQTFLAMTGNSTDSGSGVVGGGGKIWNPVPLTTKSDGNCALIFNLTFCSEVAYAVPSNPYTYPSLDALSAVYDNYAGNMYQNFNYSLQQIPCNTTSSAQYSLAKNCDDCAHAYKQWLCAVTMPRCEDYSSDLPWLQPRNMAQKFLNASSQVYTPDMIVSNLSAAYTPMPDAPSGSEAFTQSYGSVFASNSSRNPLIIDENIMPGPYKEVLPCADLCYSLVQSCPASFGFGCPVPGRGLEVDYGQRSDTNLTCSYLGAVYYLNAAETVGGNGLAAMLVAGFAGVVLMSGWV